MAVVLCILDGWGVSGDFSEEIKNPLISSHIKNYTNLIAQYPNITLKASEEAVGLVPGQMGNSEVGHYTIGAGRVVMQQLPMITRAIESGELDNNPIIKDLIGYHQNAINSCATKSCHLFGIISNGGIHGHLNHLLYVAKTLATKGIRVSLHLVTDGRDSPPESAMSYIEPILALIEEYPNHIQIATISGRYYAMDRDQRFERTIKAAAAIINGRSENKFGSLPEYIKQSYTNKITDEFIIPAAADNYQGFKTGDTFIMLNFRADRIRQIMRHIIENQNITLNRIITMSEIDPVLDPKLAILFPKENIQHCLGSVISENNLKQLRIAETEKYAHVTFFLNCGREEPYPNEDRIMIPSPKVATYDLCPEMSASAITAELIKAIYSGKYDFICVNYANADMVGHTGNFAAALKACRIIDDCLGKLVVACQETKADLLITSDHGNIEQMFDQQSNQPHTAHTLNPVPLIYVGAKNIDLSLQNANQNKQVLGLSIVAGLVLKLLGINSPREMSD